MKKPRITSPAFSFVYMTSILVFTFTPLVALAAQIDVFPGQSIQAAIDLASNDDVIVLHRGTYTEAINFNGKNITLRGTNPDDPGVVHDTVILGTDRVNSGSIVTFQNGETEGSVLSGITITKGNGDHAGGIYCVSASPTVSKCHFSENDADEGAAIYCESSSPRISDCSFSYNGVGGFRGLAGAIYIASGSSPEIRRCQFLANEALGPGAIHIEDSSPVISECVFSKNFSHASCGGAIWNQRSSSVISGSTFDDNHGGCGSAIANLSAILTISDCLFVNNENEDGTGGAIVNHLSSTIDITNSRFQGNVAWFSGGAIHNENSEARITNCVFSDNVVQDGRGGGVGSENASTIVTNCTLFHNYSVNDTEITGAQIYNRNSSVTITNTIVWDDDLPVDDEIYNLQSSPTVTYCDVRGGYAGEGNIDVNPLFFDASNKDFHLQPGSPCINTGTNQASELPDTDMDGRSRIVGGIVDIGADEYDYQPEPSDTTAPSTPTGLVATAVSSSQIDLAWTASTDNIGVTGYRIFRNGTQVPPSSTNSYSDTGLSAATTYTYTVAAYDAAGNVSAQSASASATTSSGGGDGGGGGGGCFIEAVGQQGILDRVGGVRLLGILTAVFVVVIRLRSAWEKEPAESKGRKPVNPFFALSSERNRLAQLLDAARNHRYNVNSYRTGGRVYLWFFLRFRADRSSPKMLRSGHSF